MRRHRTGRAAPWLVTTVLATGLCTPVLAQTAPGSASPAPAGTLPSSSAPADASAAAAPAAPATWASTIKFNAQLEAGASINTFNPPTSNNFGQLFTDNANTVQMNQLLLSLSRLPDPKATDYDFGFQFQALYGTDARYVQFMGEFNRTFSDRYQLAIINANVQAHLPWLTAGGIDLKVGQFPTPLGYEVIDPSLNPFYTHSYMFNFGLPFVSTGAQAVTHVNDVLDVYTGIDTGMNTTFGPQSGDNNGAIAGMAGVNLTFLGGNLTILGLTHFGPENPTRSVPGANGAYRYENDIVTTYKANDKLTFVTDLNFIRDDKFNANAFGVAQYVSYNLTDTVALNGRAEVYRDDNGFFVASFPGNHDFINAQLGYPSSVQGAGPATYSEFTLGLTWKPTIPLPVATFMIRPEVRYDQTLTNTNAYNNFSNRGQFTFAGDIVIGF